MIGDAAFANDIPKSASAATSEAKLIASDILATLTGKERQPARLRNICWSILGPDDSVKLGANYLPKDAKLEQEEGFISQRGESREVRKQTYEESVSWYAGVISDMFAKKLPGAAPTNRG